MLWRALFMNAAQTATSFISLPHFNTQLTRISEESSKETV